MLLAFPQAWPRGNLLASASLVIPLASDSIVQVELAVAQETFEDYHSDAVAAVTGSDAATAVASRTAVGVTAKVPLPDRHSAALAA